MIEKFIFDMREVGISFSLDDFGTGYSNIAAVVQMPLDIIKIDKSLVWASMANEKARVLTINIVKAFKDIGQTVLAEGVETQEQTDFLIEIGCTMLQGYLYSKPVKQEVAEKIIGTKESVTAR